MYVDRDKDSYRAFDIADDRYCVIRCTIGIHQGNKWKNFEAEDINKTCGCEGFVRNYVKTSYQTRLFGLVSYQIFRNGKGVLPNQRMTLNCIT